MPRWNTLAIKNFGFIEDNVLSVFQDYKNQFNFKNQEQTIPNDIKLNYEGDIDFYNDDVVLAYNLEAFIQRLYFFLITKKGTLPGNSEFGASLEDYVGTGRPNLNALVKNLEADLKSFDEIEYINDIKASIISNEQTEIIEINLDLKVKGFKYRTFLDLELI